MQSEFNAVLTALKEYRPRKPEYIEERLITLDNAERFYNGKKIVIDAFKNKVFSFHKKQEYEDKDEDSPIYKLKNLIDKKRREINEV